MTDLKKAEDDEQMLPMQPGSTAEMVECTKQKLDLEKQKLELEQQKDANQYSFAIKNTELLFKDRKESRITGLIAFVLITISISAFSSYALYQGKETIILELLKMLGAAFGGAGIGYAIGRKKISQTTDQD